MSTRGRHAAANHPRVPFRKTLTSGKINVKVQQFIDSGARPRFDGGDSLQMRVGRRFVRLSDASGALTAAGNEYEQRTGETLPDSGFQNQKGNPQGQHRNHRPARREKGRNSQVECRQQPL